MVPLRLRDRESMPIYQTKSKSEVISTIDWRTEWPQSLMTNMTLKPLE